MKRKGASTLCFCASHFSLEDLLAYICSRFFSLTSLLLSFFLGAFSHQYLLSRNSTFARITTFHLTKSNFAFCSIRLGEALNSSITKYWRENY